MSLFLSKKINQTLLLSIWHSTESVEELLAMRTFSEKDMLVLSSLSYEQRKKEWLIARILAEQLSGTKDIRILYDEYNKPFLENSKQYISLSHSHDLLAVILCKTETGIDIERIQTKIMKIKDKFMSIEELSSLQKENISEQMTVYWCAKESLYKLYGKKELSFKENLVIEPFQYSGKGLLKGWIKNEGMNKCFTLQYERLSCGNENYMLAYVIDED